MKANALKKGKALLEAHLHHEPERLQLVKKCYECGELMQPTRQNYQYRECGLGSVVLMNVVVYNCRCGSIVPEIPAVTDLHRLIMTHVLLKGTLLSAEEIRFIRKIAGYNASELAATIGVTKQALSRWENGRKIDKNADRLVRLVCFMKVVEDAAKAIGVKEADGSVARVVEMAMAKTSLNLTSFLAKIKDTLKGSEPVRIDPEQLRLSPSCFHDLAQADAIQ